MTNQHLAVIYLLHALTHVNTDSAGYAPHVQSDHVTISTQVEFTPAMRCLTSRSLVSASGIPVLEGGKNRGVGTFTETLYPPFDSLPLMTAPPCDLSRLIGLADCPICLLAILVDSWQGGVGLPDWLAQMHVAS